MQIPDFSIDKTLPPTHHKRVPSILLEPFDMVLFPQQWFLSYRPTSQSLLLTADVDTDFHFACSVMQWCLQLSHKLVTLIKFLSIFSFPSPTFGLILSHFLVPPYSIIHCNSGNFISSTKEKNVIKSIVQKYLVYTKIKVTEEDLYLLYLFHQK